MTNIVEISDSVAILPSNLIAVQVDVDPFQIDLPGTEPMVVEALGMTVAQAEKLASDLLFAADMVRMRHGAQTDVEWRTISDDGSVAGWASEEMAVGYAENRAKQDDPLRVYRRVRGPWVPFEGRTQA